MAEEEEEVMVVVEDIAFLQSRASYEGGEGGGREGAKMTEKEEKETQILSFDITKKLSYVERRRMVTPALPHICPVQSGNTPARQLRTFEWGTLSHVIIRKAPRIHEDGRSSLGILYMKASGDRASD